MNHGLKTGDGSVQTYRTILPALALALLASPAPGADLPRFKAPPLRPTLPWEGPYIGANIGGGLGGGNIPTTAVPIDPKAVMMNSTPSAVDGVSTLNPGWQVGSNALANTGVAKFSPSGVLGGLQAGYNFQLSPRVIAGVEADIQATNIGGQGNYAGISQTSSTYRYTGSGFWSGLTDQYSVTRNIFGYGTLSANLNWLGTFRGRAGFLALPDLLLYGTAGLAYGGVSATAVHSAVASIVDNDPNTSAVASLRSTPGYGRYSGVRTGWTAGGGGEWRVAQNWSLKAEALYYDLGKTNLIASPVTTYNVGGGALAFAQYPVSKIPINGVFARIGLNYYFDPIVVMRPVVIAGY
jgi:outer membrane immunogenic protein